MRDVPDPRVHYYGRAYEPTSGPRSVKYSQADSRQPGKKNPLVEQELRYLLLNDEVMWLS